RRDTGSWELSDDETASVAYASRSLEIEVIAENWLAWSLARDIESPLPSRYFFEFDSELVEGTDDSQYGVIFNFIDGDNYYDYTVSGQGTFSIWRKLDGEWL